jgi:hypothetical protein
MSSVNGPQFKTTRIAFEDLSRRTKNRSGFLDHSRQGRQAVAHRAIGGYVSACGSSPVGAAHHLASVPPLRGSKFSCAGAHRFNSGQRNDAPRGTFCLVRVSSYFLSRLEIIAPKTSNSRRLPAVIPTAVRIENQLDSGRHSKFLENPREVIAYRMLFNFELLSDFAVLQTVGDEANHLFLATRQQGHSAGIIKVEWLNLG